MSKIRLFGLILVLTLFFGACKSHKKASRDVVQKQKLTEVDSVFFAMKSAEFQFDWLKGKFSGIYKVDDKNSCLQSSNQAWCMNTVSLRSRSAAL